MSELLDDFKFGPIEISASHGAFEVKQAHRLGAWAVHRPIERGNRKFWCVTHIRTGLRFPNAFPTQIDAAETVRALNKLRNDWDFDSRDDPAFEVAKRFYKEVVTPKFPTHLKHSAFVAEPGKSYRVNERIAL